MVSEQEFWLDIIRRTGSNHAAEGYDAIESLINSYKLDEFQLRSLAGALRSLEQKARDRSAAIASKRKRPWENDNEPYPVPIQAPEGKAP